MSKRALQINAYVLSLTPIVEKNSNEHSSSKKAIGFLHQQNCGHAFGQSLAHVVEKIAKKAAVARKQ